MIMALASGAGSTPGMVEAIGAGHIRLDLVDEMLRAFCFASFLH